MPGPLNLRSKLIILISVLIALCTTAALAQDIVGIWQGTTQAGGPSRVLLRISKSDNGSLKADMYFLDIGTGRLPVNDLTFIGSTLTFPVPAIAATMSAR